MIMTRCFQIPLSAALLFCFAAGGSALSAQQASTPSRASPKTPAPAAPQKAKPAPADENAFPEAQSEAAQKQATEQESADSKAASSGPVAGVAPGESASSSREKFAGIDLLGDHDSRISNGAGGTVVDPKLSAQDLKVGQQYMGMGNYQGAYERFKEACTVNPANVEAVFYLAEAARKTAHLDESAENYKVYLQVQPDGSKARAARKALAQLQGK